MAKIQLKSDNINPFGGLFSILDIFSRSGFSARQLEMCRQFYRVYPIANALRSQLSWTQYRTLIQIPDPDKREYYELEAVNEGWTGINNNHQIKAVKMAFDRLDLAGAAA